MNNWFKISIDPDIYNRFSDEHKRTIDKWLEETNAEMNKELSFMIDALQPYMKKS